MFPALIRHFACLAAQVLLVFRSPRFIRPLLLLQLPSLRLLALSILTLPFLLTPPLVQADWESTGRFQLGYQSFYKTVEPKPDNLQSSGGKLELEPGFQWSNPVARVKFKALLAYDNSFKQQKDQLLAIPEEFFWERRKGRNNWIIGINTFNWGITDVINPLDVVNTRNFRNLLSPYKIGSPSITWGHSRNNWSMEFVYVPKQILTAVPPDGSRFFPRGDSLRQFAQQGVKQTEIELGAPIVISLPPDGITYQVQDPEFYNNPFDHNVGLKFRLTSNQLETHLVGFEGHPGMPNLKPTVGINITGFPPPEYTATILPEFKITPQYQRIRTAGIGFVYSGESWIAKLVHAQVWQTKANVYTAQPKTTVLAIEKPFSIRSLENTLLLQGALQTDPNQAEESTISTRAIYDKSVMLGLRTASALDWSTTFGILANPSLKVQIYSFDSSYRWNDRVQLQLVAQHLTGATGTIIESISGASSANFNIISTW